MDNVYKIVQSPLIMTRYEVIIILHPDLKDKYREKEKARFEAFLLSNKVKLLESTDKGVH